MLKLQYTETGLFMEWVNCSLEALIAQRVVLAIRLGQELHVQGGRSAFLLPVFSPGLGQAGPALDREGSIRVTPVDSEFVEIGLQGTWISDRPDADEGLFITALPEQTEFWIFKLWQESQVQVSYLA